MEEAKATFQAWCASGGPHDSGLFDFVLCSTFWTIAYSAAFSGHRRQHQTSPAATNGKARVHMPRAT